MGFFDLNIPYDTNSSSSSSSSSSSIRANRIKIVAKLMELGYSGIAYNRTIKGVMSDRDRSSIPLLNASSLQTVLPSFSASVDFHRDLLAVPRSSPFRQYTRLTVSINSSQEVLAVNSGNLVLKTYDLIAVKPLSQHAFDQACDKLEIDIISIDFAEKLPFRLKQGQIKSAMQRGVYFEIMYSDLLSDVHERRQMISTAKLLVDWTKGKNLILSSAASTVNEIRGPYDVANLSSLLGVSMERAKAAVSKNCRNLIANALKRKQFYKETVRVERISSDEKLDLNDPWSVDLFKWDPISSGEGDLLLDDIAKSFAASNTKSKNVKAIDFTSVIDSMPPQGFLVKNVISGSEANLSLNDNRGLPHVTDSTEPLVSVNGVVQQSLPDEEHLSTSDRQCSVIESCQILHSHGDKGKVSSNSDEGKSIVVEIVQLSTSMQEEPTEMDIDNVQPQNRGLSHVTDGIEPLISINGVVQQSHPDEEHFSTPNRQCSVIESCQILLSHGDKGKVSSNSEKGKSTDEEIVQLDTSMQEEPTEMDINSVQPQNLLLSSELNVISTNVLVHSPISTRNVLAVVSGNGGKKTFKMAENVVSQQNEQGLKSSNTLSGSENVQPQSPVPSSELNVVSVNELVHPASTRDVSAIVSGNDEKENFKMSEDVDYHPNECKLKSSDTLSDSENVLRDKSSTNLVPENQKNMTMVIDGTFSAAAECLLGARLGEPGDLAVTEDQEVSPLSYCISGVENDNLISIQKQTSEVLIEEQKSGGSDPHIEPPPLDQAISGEMSTENAGTFIGKRRHYPASKLPLKQLINPVAFKRVRSKQRIRQPMLLLPFKRLINPLAFKKVRKT